MATEQSLLKSFFGKVKSAAQSIRFAVMPGANSPLYDGEYTSERVISDSYSKMKRKYGEPIKQMNSIKQFLR